MVDLVRPTAAEALKIQLAAITGHEPASSYIEIRPLLPDGRIALLERAFLPVTETQAIVACVHALTHTHNVFLGVAPRTRQSGRADAVERAWCLWADLDRRDSLERLRDFRPLPTLVIRSGSPGCAHAYWALHTAVTPEGAQRANRRLALALGGDMAATDPARILRPAGSLNHKTDPPAEVECTRLTLDMFSLHDVVGRLPDTDHYRERERPAFRPVGGDCVLTGLTRTVADAVEGNRNKALFWAACRVRDHATAGELDADAALEELRRAGSHAGLPDFEIERTLRSALDARAAA